eukprot:6200170-Ditylum_brightwellii.AAC.1
MLPGSERKKGGVLRGGLIDVGDSAGFAVAVAIAIAIAVGSCRDCGMCRDDCRTCGDDCRTCGDGEREERERDRFSGGEKGGNRDFDFGGSRDFDFDGEEDFLPFLCWDISLQRRGGSC